MNKNFATQILNSYGISAEIQYFECVQRLDELKCVRELFYIETVDGRYICRLSNETNYPIPLIERQSFFAMMLYKNGVITAKKLQSNGCFCTEMSISNIPLKITLEEYLGKDLEDISLDSFFEFGSLLGRIHCVSENNRAKIGKSFISEAINNNRTDINRIFNHAIPLFGESKIKSELASAHDYLIKQTKSYLGRLPCGAVHGDLGIFNNLIDTVKGIGVIDFNLAADEAYIMDAVITYYSSIHKYAWQKKYESIGVDQIHKYFWKGYFQERSLNDLELECLSTISSLFDGLFYCKYLVDMWNSGEHDKAKKCLSKAMTCFCKNNKVITLT